jgi:hypothetical protein
MEVSNETRKTSFSAGEKKEAGETKTSLETGESSVPLVQDALLIPNALLIQVPEALLCPISGTIMSDPVFCSDGYTYDRINIEKYLNTHHTSPVTGLPLRNTTLTPDELCLQNLKVWNSTPSAPPLQVQVPAYTPSSLLKLSKHFFQMDPVREDLSAELDGWKPPVVVVFGEESW